MAFIDNSKDIIIDAVLTDLGRKRLAEGRFNIARFALGDDEINYKLYDKENANGSAYYDLEILRTPVFEAFTNNISTMNSRLVTYSANDLLYLPVIKLNTSGAVSTRIDGGGSIKGGQKLFSSNNISPTFLVAINTETLNSINDENKINGIDFNNLNYIRLDQGLDTTDNVGSKEKDLSPELIEEQYQLEIDNRFGYIAFSNQKLNPLSIDDDNVASYLFNNFDELPYVVNLLKYDATSNTLDTVAVKGSRGTSLMFSVYASNDLQSSDSSLFDIYGVAGTIGSNNYKLIHSTITITGLKTGFSIDIPVSFIKKV